MNEEVALYIEMYPIYKALLKNVDDNIEKIVTLPNGESVPGRIIDDSTNTNVQVEYSLENITNSKILIDELRKMYSNYNNINFKIVMVESNSIDEMAKPVSIIVLVPSEFNKQIYLNLDKGKQQQLKIEVANNINRGLVTFNKNSSKRI